MGLKLAINFARIFFLLVVIGGFAVYFLAEEIKSIGVLLIICAGFLFLVSLFKPSWIDSLFKP